MSADAAVLREAGIGPGVDPHIAKLDEEIDGLRTAGRLMGEAQRCARFHYWSGRSSAVAIHAIAGARARLAREVKKLKAARFELEERIFLP
jgi:hypothetical protein